jgi:hypothetical protein
MIPEERMVARLWSTWLGSDKWAIWISQHENT